MCGGYEHSLLSAFLFPADNVDFSYIQGTHIEEACIVSKDERQVLFCVIVMERGDAGSKKTPT